MNSGRRPCLAYDTPYVRRRSLWKRFKHAFKSSALHANTLSTTRSRFLRPSLERVEGQRCLLQQRLIQKIPIGWVFECATHGLCR